MVFEMVKHFRKYFFGLLCSYYSYINAILPFENIFSKSFSVENFNRLKISSCIKQFKVTSINC